MNQVAKNSNTTILIIDDQPSNLAVLVDFLEDLIIEVVVAENGESGFTRAKYVVPDLILLDVLMPGQDGFQTCQRLKGDEKTANIPVIFLTALTDVKEKVKGFECGGVDYVTKPLQLEEVWARINTHLTVNRLQQSLRGKNQKLSLALSEIKTLQGILPLCSFCKKVRDDKGYWQQVDEYIQKHTEADVSHGLCPDCLEEHYPEISRKIVDKRG